MPITTIREVGGADTLKIEGLVLQGVHMSHMGAGHKADLPVVSICMVWTETGKTVCIVGPGLHKAT
jgi:hypothetical protein